MNEQLSRIVGQYIIQQLEKDEHLDALRYAKNEPDTEKQAEVIIADYLHYYHKIPWEVLGRLMWIV